MIVKPISVVSHRTAGPPQAIFNYIIGLISCSVPYIFSSQLQLFSSPHTCKYNVLECEIKP